MKMAVVCVDLLDFRAEDIRGSAEATAFQLKQQTVQYVPNKE